MNALSMSARPTSRFSAQPRPDWPDTPLTVDPDAMHPRAVEMAQAMREGLHTFRDLIGAGYTTAEIAEFKDEAKALATSLSTRQASPGADRLSEMVAKATAAIANRMPLPKGASETQKAYLAWNRYCAAVAAFRLDPWPAQRERCLDLLRTYFSATPAGPAVTGYVVGETASSMGARH